MKPLEFSSWFEEQEARFAVLSTFEFDPVHFESRLLRSKALSQARRVLVFVDAGQFQKALAEKRPARWINQRYLVVPVHRKRGVFHPKLGLLFGEQHVRLLCGSNNLTQAGSAHNLELLNSILITAENSESLTQLDLVREALAFFKSCCPHGEGHTGKIALAWLDEASKELPLLSVKAPRAKSVMELVHTLEGSLWNWLNAKLEDASPSKIQVISPFYDSDLRLLQRIRERWPKCTVEITAQQQTSNLPVGLLKDFVKSIRLFDVSGVGSRRLHAKLLVVTAGGKTVCLAGSANFTSAAFDGVNVETCLAWEANDDPVNPLFDADVKRAAISPEEFEPGDELPPEQEASVSSPLRIKSAMLDASGKLSVSFTFKTDSNVQNFSIALQQFGELVPAICLNLKSVASGVAETSLKSELAANFGAAIACYLIADIGTNEITSPISWLIQEHRLTHETSEDSNGNSREMEVRETGRGLIEHLDEIATKEGQLQLIEYLKNLRIRFDDNTAAKRIGRGFKIKICDPFRPDTIPDWLNQFKGELSDVETAVYEFADYHERKVLRRHARAGNINGLPNFLDILMAMTRLLFVFYRRGVLTKNQVIGRLVQYIDIFTDGFKNNEDASPGYISSMSSALSGNPNQLRKAFNEQNVAGHLRTLLLIAQTVRCDPKEKGAGRPAQCLRSKLDRIRECLERSKLGWPKSEQVEESLRAYEMLSAEEAKKWVEEL